MDEHKRDHTTEEIIRPGRGNATSSKSPRYDLIPYYPLLMLASRFEVGLPKHGKDNWRKGVDDDDFIIERCNHVIEHAKRLIEKLEGRRPPDGDNDAAGIMWGGTFLCEATKNKPL